MLLCRTTFSALLPRFPRHELVPTKNQGSARPRQVRERATASFWAISECNSKPLASSSGTLQTTPLDYEWPAFHRPSWLRPAPEVRVDVGGPSPAAVASSVSQYG